MRCSLKAWRGRQLPTKEGLASQFKDADRTDLTNAPDSWLLAPGVWLTRSQRCRTPAQGMQHPGGLELLEQPACAHALLHLAGPSLTGQCHTAPD